jgi:glycosyltransferase involved in cell wall biosynthesis
MTFFSIIIPTYNRSNEIVKAIDSVLNQDFKDFEIIVIDDFSTDGTEELIRGLEIPNLVYIKNQRTKGASGARNSGCAIAKGEWLAFLDSDDCWEKNKLSVLYETIKSDYYEIYYSAYYNDDRVSIIHGFCGNHLQELYFKNVVRGFSLFVLKKDLFWSVGGLDESFKSKQDLDLYIRLAKNYEFGFIRTPLIFFGVYSINRISDNKEKRLSGWLDFYEKYSFEMPIKAKVYHSKCILTAASNLYKIPIMLRFLFIYSNNVLKMKSFV